MDSNWEVLKMEHLTDNGVVYSVVSIYSIQEQINEDEIAYARDVIQSEFTADPTSPSYIPFEDLTEEIVLGWVFAEIDKEQVEADVLIKFEANKYEIENPKSSDSFPPNWN